MRGALRRSWEARTQRRPLLDAAPWQTSGFHCAVYAPLQERGVLPNAQCYFLGIMGCVQARELTMASW